jgi:transcriptional regulator with XRE-family HTH domain
MPVNRNKVDPEVGRRITAAMTYMGISVNEVASALKVSQPAVSNWRIGKTLPDQSHMQKLAKMLKQSVDWLMFGKTELGSLLDKRLTDIALSLSKDTIDLLATPGLPEDELRSLLEQLIERHELQPPSDGRSRIRRRKAV